MRLHYIVTPSFFADLDDVISLLSSVMLRSPGIFVSICGVPRTRSFVLSGLMSRLFLQHHAAMFRRSSVSWSTHSWSGPSTISFSTTAEPNNYSSALWVQLAFMLCTKFNIANTCDHLEDLFITFTHHFWNNDSFSAFKVHLKPVPLPLELVKWDKQWSRQSERYFSVHGVRSFPLEIRMCHDACELLV